MDGKPGVYLCDLDEDEDYSISGSRMQRTRSQNMIFPDQQPIVKHVYYLRNRGPSALQMANFTIFWPERTVENRPLFELIAQPNIRVINQRERVPGRGSAKIRVDKEPGTEAHLPTISVHCEHIELQAIVRDWRRKPNHNWNVQEVLKVDP